MPLAELTTTEAASAALSASILDATLDLVAEVGSISALRVDAIAARCKTSKANIYRRWSSKSELVAAAVGTIRHGTPILPHASLRDDLLRLWRRNCELPTREKAILRTLLLEAGTSLACAEHQEGLMASGRAISSAVLRHWIARRELRADIDVELAAATLNHTLMIPMLYGPHDPYMISGESMERVIDYFLRGVEVSVSSL